MDDFLGVLSNREAALIIWLLVFLILALFWKKTRSSLWDLIKFLLQKKFLIVFLLLFLYVGLELSLLWVGKLWDTSLITDTVFWIIGTAFMLLFDINKASEEDNYFRIILLKSFGIAVAVEFIVNFYSLSLWLELVLLPALTFIIILNTIAGMKEKHEPALRLTNTIISLCGIALFSYIVFRTMEDYRVLATLDNLRAFMLPFLLTLFLIPFLYFFALYMAYESLFVRLDRLPTRDHELCKLAKRRILILCHINLRKLLRFAKENNKDFSNLFNEEDVLALLNSFRERNM